MAKTDALSILQAQSTKDKLAEKDGALIDSIQKDALSSRLKNTEYSGDPTTGSVVINRFKNSASNAYGTARAAGKGGNLLNNGKVTINIDTDKEIIEEIEGKDITMHAVQGLIDRRTANHSKRMAAELDRAFFATAEDAATEITTTATGIEDIVEAAIQKIETTNNDWVDGVDRADIEISLTPKAYGKLRKYVDKIDFGVGVGEEQTPLFHGARVYSNTRQTADLVIMYHGAVAQPVAITPYDAEHIGLSNAYAIELFYSFGTKAVMPDLIGKIEDIEGGESE